LISLDFIFHFRPVPYPEYAAEEERYQQWEKRLGTTADGSLPPDLPSEIRTPSITASSLGSTLSRLSLGSLHSVFKNYRRKRKESRVLAAETAKHLTHSLSDPQLLDQTMSRLRKCLSNLVAETLLYFNRQELLDHQMR
jgi:hypothetical protein